MGCSLRTTTQPSMPAVFSPGLPSSLRMRRELSDRNLAQRLTTSSTARGKRHGLSVTCHPPTERACYFFRRLASIFRRRRDFRRERTLVRGEEDVWRARSGACRDTPRQADLRKIKGHSCGEFQPVGRRIARLLRPLLYDKQQVLCEESS